jgi:hypothetical protein
MAMVYDASDEPAPLPVTFSSAVGKYMVSS